MAFKAPAPSRSSGPRTGRTRDTGVVLMDADGGARVVRLVSGDNRRSQAGRKAPSPAGARGAPPAESVSNLNVSALSLPQQSEAVQATASHRMQFSGIDNNIGQGKEGPLGHRYSTSIWEGPPSSSAALPLQIPQSSCLPINSLPVSLSGHSTNFIPPSWSSPAEELQGQKGFPCLMSQILESGSQSNSKIKNNSQDTSAGMNSYAKTSSNASVSVDTRAKLQDPPNLSDEFRPVTMYPFGNYNINTAFGEPQKPGDKLATTVKKEKDTTTDWVTHSNAVLSEANDEKKVSETHPNICALCGARYRTKGGLHSHTIYKHSDARPFRCELCGATFKVHSKLTRHKVEKHCDDRPYVCPVCGVSFKRKDKLGRHNRTLHSGDRPFVCHTCGKAFKRREVLRHHEAKHFNGDRHPHECPDCGKRFGRKDKMKEHTRKEHGAKRGVNVEICNNQYSVL